MGWLLVIGAIAAILGGIYLTLGITTGRGGQHVRLNTSPRDNPAPNPFLNVRHGDSSRTTTKK
jgi:hypothetical protein